MTDLLPCPFCGMKPPKDLIDTLYPSGRWREDDGLRHYLLPGDKREGHGRTWAMHCTQNMGGCGAEVGGDSRDEAVAAWNRRTSVAQPANTDSVPGSPASKVTRPDQPKLPESGGIGISSIGLGAEGGGQ